VLQKKMRSLGDRVRNSLTASFDGRNAKFGAINHIAKNRNMKGKTSCAGLPKSEAGWLP
jgi:hypothetical protein